LSAPTEYQSESRPSTRVNQARPFSPLIYESRAREDKKAKDLQLVSKISTLRPNSTRAPAFVTSFGGTKYTIRDFPDPDPALPREEA
jgi:hypothetical protein